MKRVLIGLGSSEGDRLGVIADALDRIDGLTRTTVLRVSHAYETEPWGGQTDALFANAVAEIDTPLEADDLLGALQEIEIALGRTPGPRFGSRPIDLDILLVDDEEWDTPELTIPHPRLLQRDFVVRPLLELEPEATMPDGTRVTAQAATEGPVVRTLGPLPRYEDRTPARASAGALADADNAQARRVAAIGALAPDEEWKPVFEMRSIGHREVRPDAGVIFIQMVLDQEEIPWAWDPFPPEDSSNPWGLPARFKLMVPASMLPQAARAIAEARSAPPDWEEMAGAGTGTPEE